MKWKIISHNDSIFAKRLSRIFGLEVCRKPIGDFDGLLFFSMLLPQRTIINSVKKIPKICYWTGTDAKLFLEDKKSNDDFGNAIHVTDSPWLVIRLSKKLSQPCFLPLPPYLSVLDIPIDKPSGILMYLTRHMARDIERSKALIKEITDIPIYILNGKGEKIIDRSFAKNVIDLDWISDEKRESLFRKISVHVRLMNFDGFSQTVIEMKMLGRHVFYTNEVPFCNLVAPGDSPKKIADMVREKIDAPQDMEGALWYRSVFSKENFLEIIKQLCAAKGWDFPYGIIE